MVHLGGVDEAEPLGELESLPNQRLPHPLVGHRRLHQKYSVHLDGEKICNMFLLMMIINIFLMINHSMAGDFYRYPETIFRFLL